MAEGFRPTVTVKGTAEVLRALDHVGTAGTDLAVPNRAIAGYIAGAVRSAAPHRSGYLASTVSASGDDRAVNIAVSAEYGGVQEWGWRARNIPGQHYAARAIRSSEGRITAEYTREMERLTREAG